MADVIITGDDDSVSSEWCPEVLPYENTDSYDGAIIGNSANKESRKNQPQKDCSQEIQPSENCVSLLLSLRNSERSEALASFPSQVGSLKMTLRFRVCRSRSSLQVEETVRHLQTRLKDP